jgi:hypothetical protein
MAHAKYKGPAKNKQKTRGGRGKKLKGKTMHVRIYTLFGMASLLDARCHDFFVSRFF